MSKTADIKDLLDIVLMLLRNGICGEGDIETVYKIASAYGFDINGDGYLE